MSALVRFQDVSKRYAIGGERKSLRGSLGELPGRLLGRGSPGGSVREHIWALRDVSFALEPGQILGLVGRNGTGKTTTLKLLARVIQPTRGRIEVNGRVAALIELGAGFHPELTGRENVYLNGVILGLSRKEIDRKFDSIVAFAEIEKFIDTPVKRYSSGMYARLGFAVAAHSDPDLLLVDEVLAVGDVAFQQKCFDFLHSFVNGGKTAVFVSHSLWVLEQLCNRLIWLDGGQVVQAGDPGQVLPAYLDKLDQSMTSPTNLKTDWNDHISLAPAAFFDSEGTERDGFASGEDIVVSVPYQTDGPLERPHFVLGVIAADGPAAWIFLASMLVDGHAPEIIDGEGEIRCRFRSVPLLPRAYSLYCEVWGSDRSQLVVKWRKVGTFRVTDEGGPTHKQPGKGGIRQLRADACVRVEYEWENAGAGSQSPKASLTCSPTIHADPESIALASVSANHTHARP